MKENLTLNRDGTFIKIVERTCKRDAYQSVYSWGKGENVDKETIMWFLKQKIDGHTEFLNSLDLEYNYATQSLGERQTFTETVTEVPDGSND